MKSNISYWCESKVNRLWLLIITQTETHVIQRHLKLNSRAVLTRNSSLSPLLLKTLIMLYRLGTSDVYGNTYDFMYQAEQSTEPSALFGRIMVLTRPVQDSEHSFNITAAAWIHSHSDVVVAAVSLELAEPPLSKKGHVKTKHSLSGDLTASSVLSSHLACHHNLKPFLKTNEAVPPAAQCPWRLPQLSLGNVPQISSSPPRNSPLRQRNLPAAGLALLHSSSWPLCNNTQHLTHSSGAISEANATVQFLFCTTTHRLIPRQPWDSE